ncbi:hypothetical protein KY284_032526 [Solanum tuberosum]|nr:hypothetical protein KY284_032526 [Solanum tuberosum]
MISFNKIHSSSLNKESTGLSNTNLNSISIFYSLESRNKESTGLPSTNLNSIYILHSLESQILICCAWVIGRGRGQGLKSLTSKGKFPTKSLVFPSSDLVKQYIQEVETSAIGKGRGAGHKNSTMSPSQVSTPFRSFTNQVKQCTKEVETILLNYTTVRSSNPRKVKRIRGSNKCKEVASLEAGTKLKVTFYNNRTVGTNSNLFSRNLGKIIRDCNMCPLGVSSCSDIKQLKFDHMWAAVTAQIKEILKVEPSLPSIEIVEKCCGPQTHSHVFGFGGGVKAKDMRGGTFSKTELLSELCSTQEENKSLNEKNKSFNDRLSTLEDEMNEIRKRKEFIAAKQSHNPHTTSPVSIE